MPSLLDYTDYTDNQAVEPTIDPNITRIVVRPQQKEPDVKEPEDSTVKHIFDRLFGLNGEERYQLWPEKVVREGLSAAHDAMTGDIPQYSIDENTGDVHTSPQMIKAGVDMSSLAGTGGLAGVGNEAGTALGATPFLRPALKYGEKLYKGKEGAQHVDLIPEDLYPTFQKQAMNGEDISHWNFGFHNDKGHFLDREKALQYGIDNGIIDPQAGKFGALTSTMMADSSKPGIAIEAMAQSQPKFDFNVGASSGSKSVKLGPTEITYGVNPKNNDVELSLIKTDKDKRGQGSGRAAIEQFLNEADANNKRVLLNADPMDKSTNKGKLEDFYKSLGFVRNKGRNKDFTTRAEFIRNPFLKSDNEAGLGVGAINATNKPFYSAVENAVAGAKQPKADAQQWLSFLKNQPGVKQEELQHLGLDKLSGSITKDDLLKAVQEGQPQIKEVVKDTRDTKLEQWKVVRPDGHVDSTWTNPEGAAKQAEKIGGSVKEAHETKPMDNTKYSKYQLPGGENYREMLLTLPNKQQRHYEYEYFDPKTQTSKQFKTEAEAKAAAPEGAVVNPKEIATTDEAYKSSHWDEPNVLAHIRMNDRMIPASFTKEELAALDAHSAAKPKIDEIRNAQTEVAKEISATSKPLEAARKQQILNDLKSGKISNSEAMKRLEDYKSPQELKPLQDKLADLRKQEDDIRNGLPVKPIQKNLKSLHLEEIQSDWHQEGRKKGYKQDNKNKLSVKNEGGIWRVRNENGERVDLNGAAGFSTEEGARSAIASNTRDVGGVPDAPFKKTWDELALKKAITEAVKNGYDQISWTPGEAQAARYDLSKQVDSIKYLKNDDGTYNIVPFKNDRPVHSVEGENIKPEKLPDIVGKEVAEKIVNGHGDREKGASDIRVLSGQDLKVGGQGMKAFYDKMLVDKANALVKKHGGKVEKLKTKAPEFGVFQRINQISPDFPTAAEARAWGKENGYEGKATVRESKAGNPHEMWTVKITPELREHVLKKGFPLFSAGVPVFTPVEGNPFKDNK